MLEPEEFEFYDLLEIYKNKFGEMPPTYHLEPKDAKKLIEEALKTGIPIKNKDSQKDFS